MRGEDVLARRRELKHDYDLYFSPCCYETFFIATLFKTNNNITLIFSISGGATEVFFHVTVMSLDTIDEGSMVSYHNIK